MAEVDVVAFNWHPAKSLASELGRILFFPHLYIKTLIHNRPPKHLGTIFASWRLRRHIRRRYPGQFKGSVEWVEHHLAHAASAYYLSGKAGEPATALVVDGHGDDCATSLYRVEGGRFIRLRSWPIWDSLGIIYTNFTHFLGFGAYQEGKTMALASFGTNRLAPVFERVISLQEGGYRVANKRYLGLWHYRAGRLAPELGLPRKPGAPLTQDHYDIAHAMQSRVKDAVLHVLDHVAGLSGGGNLVLAGGVFLNCDLNHDILAGGRWASVFVPPCTSDSGGALGAGLYAACSTHGERLSGAFSPYLGPAYSEDEMRAALDGKALAWNRPESLVAAAARALHGGQVVGWFQGRMECGPRALGNRSILADPGRPGIQAHLNANIKHREHFRPFAPIATPEAALRCFELAEPLPVLADYMLLTVKVRPEWREKLAGIVHVDGSARIQVVRPEANPLLHGLLVEFGRLSGYEVLLNTSFNRHEPIVCSPEDAVNCFAGSGLDRLFMGPFQA
jgi:carbamoyltransferase